jgi:phosphoglycolate phosphatase
VIPRFRAYLFDIDGTLLDSALDICGAIQQTLEPTGCGPLTFEYLRGFIGLHLIDCFSDVLPHYTPQQMDELVQIYRGHYPARGHLLTTVYPGVVEGLAGLDARKTTATTKGTNGSRAILDQFGLLPYFDHVQGTDGFPCKPAPDVILRGIEALGVDTKDCLMVGDSPSDIAAGKRAGVKTCAVRYGYGKPEELAQIEPDYWISDLRELL